MTKKRRKNHVKRMLPASRTPDKTAPIGVGRTYKDTLFRFIFRDKGNLLQLYNALNDSAYQDEQLLKITTIDNVIYLGYKNDVSFLLDEVLCLVEQQSTWNPNMPIRGVWYFARLYRNFIEERDLDYLGTKRLELPFPQYIVFYNGTAAKPEQELLTLSDSFPTPGYSFGELKIPALECRALVLNINYGKNRELLEKCKPLLEYSKFVHYIRENLNKGIPADRAADLAIDRCMEEGILTEILQKHRKEVVGMFLEEYDETKHMKTLYNEGYEDGHDAGYGEGKIEALYSVAGFTPEQIAQKLEMPIEEVIRIIEKL